jgi:uncharacterized protein (DUF2225 family)
VFKKRVQCIWDNTAFEVFKLYPSAREKFERWDEFFDIPIYLNERNDPLFHNYLLMDVKVCPTCFFGSNDESYFTSPPAVAPDLRVREVINQGKALRESMATQASNLFEETKRDLEDAVISYRIGIFSSEGLYKVNPRRYAIEAIRKANYVLKVARLYEEVGDLEHREKWLRVGLSYFQQGLEADVKGVITYKTLYQCAALGVYFGQDVIASRAFDRLNRLPERETSKELLKYLNRIRRIWEERDSYRSGFRD